MRVRTALGLCLAAWASGAAASQRRHSSGSSGWNDSHHPGVSTAIPSATNGSGVHGISGSTPVSTSSQSLSTLLNQLSADQRPEWLTRSPVLGALTSSAGASLANGDALVDGIVVRIAPRFVVTATSLLSQRGLARLRSASVATRAVVFSGAVAEVTRVTFESDYFGAQNYSLVVLELREELATDSVAPLAQIITSTPNKGFEFEQLRLLNVGSLLDSKAVLADSVTGRVTRDTPTEQSRLTFFVEPMCGFKLPAAEDSLSITELCVGHLAKTSGTSYFDSGSWHRERRELASSENHRSPWPSDSSMHHGPPPHRVNASSGSHFGSNDTHEEAEIKFPESSTPATDMQAAKFSLASVLLYGNNVVGLSIPSMAVTWRFQSTLDSKYGFLRLAAPDHREFLGVATNQTVQYEDDDVFSKLSKYPSYLATFLDASGNKLSCQGVLIASKFVLTTASCLSAEPNISAVQFYASDPAQRETVNVVRAHMAAHPRYTKGSVAYDTAVIALERAVSSTPIQLDDGSAGDNSSLARIQVADDDMCVISATVASHDSNVCGGASASKLKTGAAMCVVPVAAADRTPTAFSAKTFVGDDAVAKVEAQSPTTHGAALVTVTRLSSVALVGLAVKSGKSTASSRASTRRRDLQSASEGEVYVRVANSATFINAYVTGTSWTVTAKMMVESFDTSSSGADDGDVKLPAGEQFVVGLRTTKDGQNYCGGSLIGPTSVLTAAHCVVDGPAHFVSIGAYNSSGVEAEVIAVLSDKTQIHGQYGKPHQFSFDVAILELAFASAVQPVQLDDTVDFTARESATMYGYGMSSATSGLSPTLRAVSMPLWSRVACSEVFGDAVDDSMLCAGGEKGKDACTGDSGSPLVMNRGGKNLLVGVVSAGSGCGLENVPGVYARIHSVRDFVSSHAIGVEWDSASHQDGETGSTAGSPGASSGQGDSQQNSSAIEAREASDVTSVKATTTTTTSPATGPYNVATLELADLSPLVRTSLMDFLLGEDAESVMDAATIAAMKASDNVLRLYSTGELSALLAIVARHNKLPLNQRRDRFRQWSGSYSGSGNTTCSA